VLHYCASSTRDVNLHILAGQVEELWMNIKMAKAGLCCDRLKRQMYSSECTQPLSKAKTFPKNLEEATQAALIERHFMQEVNLFTVDRIVQAIAKGDSI
jgi:hypothetical protein